MKTMSFVLGMAMAFTPALASAQNATNEPSVCSEGDVLNRVGDCVPEISATEGLGFPSGLEITNFTPFVLPGLAVVGAVIAAGAVNGDGGSSNSTN